ncbi:MAG: acyl-[acyl-carrier-protein] thioesterase [Lachnospiraceae bacterium]|nr:acyl-[acyl-carrier-protein] thioesterase [Lachnospiraceae bacterium]
MYMFQSRIRYSETDKTGHLKLESLLDYFQDCSTFHSEDIGLGLDYCREHHVVWVMSSWQIVVKRYPLMGEKVTIGTLPYEFKGFVGYRNFCMKDEQGVEIACANTIWSLLSTDTGKPAKPDEKMLEGYKLEPKLPMEYAPRRIKIPENSVSGEPIVIKSHHLDTNQHVNNGQFIRIAMESLEQDFPVIQLRAEYKKQVLLGDILTPHISRTDEGRHVVVLENGEGDVCCIVELEEGTEGIGD